MPHIDVGSLCVALSASLFAAQTALIKLIDVPPILLLQVRSAALWILSLLVAVFGRRCGLIRSTTPISLLLLGEPGERTRSAALLAPQPRTRRASSLTA